MDYSIREDLSFQNIRKVISDEEIYAGYIGAPIQLDTKYCSVFRSNDVVPSLSFYVTPNHWLMHKDFGRNDRAGNVFDFVRKLYQLENNWQAAVQINKDFGLGLLNLSKTSPKPSVPIKRMESKRLQNIEKTIRYKPRPFLDRDYYYWSKFNISKNILQNFNIHVADIVFINNVPIWVYEMTNPIYVYTFNDKLKFYRPLTKNKDGKFLSSKNIGDVYAGYEQLPKNGKELIITKAMKDVMTLYSLGITAIAPNGETYAFNPLLIKELEDRFEKIYIMLDNDWHKPIEENTGINAMKNFTSKYPEIMPLIIPDQLQCTDIAEVMEKYGASFTKQVINHVRKNSRKFS